MKPLTLPPGESWSVSPNPDVGCFQPGDLPGDSHKAAPCKVTSLLIPQARGRCGKASPPRRKHRERPTPFGGAETPQHLAHQEPQGGNGTHRSRSVPGRQEQCTHDTLRPRSRHTSVSGVGGGDFCLLLWLLFTEASGDVFGPLHSFPSLYPSLTS